MKSKIGRTAGFLLVAIVAFGFPGFGPAAPGASRPEREIEQELAYELLRREEDSGRASREEGRVIRTLPADTDNDGMPDAWEDDNGLDPENPADAWFDADNDHVYNLFEYQLGYQAFSPGFPPVVTVAATGANYSNVATALGSVASGTAIRVAAGHYPCNYRRSVLHSDVVMIQGGWNADFSQRDLALYETVLDGGMTDEILYFSIYSGNPVIILDGLHLIRGAGDFGAVNLLSSGTASMKSSVVNCAFSESTTSSHGGILSLNSWNSSESDRTVANTLIAGNFGSGIYAQVTDEAQSRWRILDSTITGNQSIENNGYGLDAFTLYTGVLDVAVYNSIFWGNARGSADISRSITLFADYCDMDAVITHSEAVYTPGAHNLAVNPAFVGAGNYHLRAVSPCVDKGVAGRGPGADLEGHPRPDPVSGELDMGCYEFAQGTPTPTPIPQEVPASGDYNGDGTSDIALFRPASGLWLIRGLTRAYFGASSDFPVPRDYNGDGTWDIAVFKVAQSKWLVRNGISTWFGAPTDTVVPDDYNGDGTVDLAVFRPASGLWLVQGVTRVYFGTSTDTVVPADYSGDGATDIAVFKAAQSKWMIHNGLTTWFGAPTDTVVPGDYDGDGKCDIAVFRPASGLWLARGVTRAYFGASSDTVQPADFDGDGTWDFALFRPASGLWLARGATRAYFGASTDRPVTNP